MNRSALETQPELPVDPTRGGVTAGDVERDADGGGIAGNARGEAASSPRRRRWISILAVTVAAVTLIFGVAAMIRGVGGPEETLVYYTAKRGDLPITVTERGTLESQFEEKVLCAMDDIEGDNMHGTPILWVIPNGASVKKDELIVELDVSSHRERLDRQIIDEQDAISYQIQAKVKFDNSKTQNETTKAEAQLKVELHELALKQFEDETGGTFQIDLQDLELLIQEAQAGKLIEETNLEGVEQLYKLGYRSRGELAQARLSAMKTERQLASAVAKKKELVQYQYRKKKLELKGALESAKRALVQVERDNIAILGQAEAVMNAADERLKKERERLARYHTQVKNAKIYAPKAGMIAYNASRHRYYRADIREGASIRPRQHILSIPDLQRMQIRTYVHESVLDQVTSGLPATVRVEALPGRTYRASVASVAVLADQDRFSSSGTKVYETVVTIDEEVEQLKPGMSAVIEIHVVRLKDVVSVPVQAVVQRGARNWCYVDVEGSPERRDVKLGRTNDKFVVITSGVESDERVVLNPTAILEQNDDSRNESEISPEQGASPEPPPVAKQSDDDQKSDDAKKRRKRRQDAEAKAKNGLSGPGDRSKRSPSGRGGSRGGEHGRSSSRK